MELQSPTGFSVFGFSYVNLQQLNRKCGEFDVRKSEHHCTIQIN